LLLRSVRNLLMDYYAANNSLVEVLHSSVKLWISRESVLGNGAGVVRWFQ